MRFKLCMSDGLKIACVIPARGGSKGVPRKNIKPLGGIPLIGYTIRSAKNAGSFLKVVAVSTEDKEVAKVAESLGAEIIDRPPELSEDHVKSEPVLAHALQALESRHQIRFSGVMLLSPTCPFRDPSHIRRAVELFSSGELDTIVGLVPVYKYQYKIETASVVPLFSERKNRQEREPVWLENGALYLTRSDLIRQKKVIGSRIGYVAMDELASINIDSPVDFLQAEAVMGAGLYKFA